MANIKQTVDLTQGTFNNLVVVNNKLQLCYVGSPSFSRNSIAYLSDVTLVNTNLPRYEQGKFGKAVMVEEGTVNRLRANIHTWRDYTSEATTYSITNVSTPYGSGVKLTGTSAGRVGKLTTGDINLGTSYATASVYFKPNSASGTLRIYWDTRDNTGALRYGVFKNQTINLANCVPGTWYRLVCTADISPYTFGSGGSGFYIWAEGTFDVEIAAPQLEAKPYPTSFIDGTRAAESLTIHTAGVLNPQEGAVECWVYVPEFWKQGIPNWRRIWGVGRDTGAGMYVLRYDPDNGKTVFGIYNNAGTAQNISVDKPSVGWHYFAAKWSASEMALLIDGVKVGSITNPNLPSNFADNVISIGCRPDSPYDNVNTLIDDLRISNRARTDAEILAAYQSGQPLPVDEWTTCLLRFDDNLNYGQGGYYISPEYDVSSVNKAARGKVYWQEDADGIQRIVYAKLDNQADWTQVTNGGLLPISAGDVLTNRKLQLKVKMLKVI